MRRGILCCGTGIGISIAANKVKGIRCCACSDCYSAEMSRVHNDANMLALGARVVGTELGRMIARSFLAGEFEGGRHQRRIDQITAIENGRTWADEHSGFRREAGAFAATRFSARLTAAAARGGGRVSVPAGEYETAGLVLRINVELHLEAGAVLRFVDDFDAYRREHPLGGL